MQELDRMVDVSFNASNDVADDLGLWTMAVREDPKRTRLMWLGLSSYEFDRRTRTLASCHHSVQRQQLISITVESKWSR